MEACRNGRPHAVVVPYPMQGHINPMMHLAKKLASHGFLVTFITTQHAHSRILRANNIPSSLQGIDVELRSIADGLPDEDPRTDLPKLAYSAENSMPLSLRKLIQEMNSSEDLPAVRFIIADFFAGWALEVAEELGIQAAAFWPAQIATYALIHHSALLHSKGVLPSNGIPDEKTMVKYLPSMPSLCSANLPWLTGSSLAAKESRFQFWLRNLQRVRKVKRILCNSFHHLELPIINTFPEQAGICPIGPLIACDHILNSNTLNLWREDLGCLEWLDKKPPNSVIYVSFGSLAILNEKQVEELALALEATQHPFLCVVRSDLMNRSHAAFPEGYMERVVSSGQGCIVSWAPQASVLSHPSVACFITHCGWNSTLESITAGVPIICWPYNVDQFLNCAYIVQEWKIGLSLNTNEAGIVDVQEIQKAVQTMMNGEGSEMKKRVVELKECAIAAVKGGGSSYITFNQFLNDIILQH